MGRIFVTAGRGNAIVDGTTETQEMMLLRDQVVQELRSRGFQVLSVPDEFDQSAVISWINSRAQADDIAVILQAETSPNPNTRGASAYYITNNSDRKSHAELLLLALLRRLPQLPNLGAKPDTSTVNGRLVFCRDTTIPSLAMEVGFLTNPEDRSLIQTRRRDMSLGIADGLAAWSRTISGPEQPILPTPVNITINSQTYGEKGILINQNAYIPVDLADRLGINLHANSQVRRVQHCGVVYLKAIELREFNIAVNWDANNQILALRSILTVAPEQIENIMGVGKTSEVQMMMFLKANHPDALSQFPDLPKLYIEEGNIEGVNYDIAFCQMCLETNFLRFGANVAASQYNFAYLGSVNGSEVASFPSIRVGIRAQIQHLKAYASLEPLVQEQVDPRFQFVTRGVAPKTKQLGGRWSAQLDYGDKITATLRRLYESADLL
jgi:hypothetical protein